MALDFFPYLEWSGLRIPYLEATYRTHGKKKRKKKK